MDNKTEKDDDVSMRSTLRTHRISASPGYAFDERPNLSFLLVGNPMVGGEPRVHVACTSTAAHLNSSVQTKRRISRERHGMNFEVTSAWCEMSASCSVPEDGRNRMR